MNKYTKLFNNSIIFFIGSFGSKLIIFVMLPLYTNKLSPEEYGTVDLMQTSINLLIPVVTMELGQAALRFSIEKNTLEQQNKIFSSIKFHGILSTILIMLTYPILKYFQIFNGYTILFVLLLMIRVYDNLFTQFIRGIGKVKEFAVNGILLSVFTVFFNIILLVYFNLKVEGFILSLILATTVSLVYIFWCVDGVSRIKNFSFDASLYKNMITFSLPIIPNSAMWWVINGSTKYFVLFFVGASANGIYAVATKIPTIISMVTSIFTQAWQLSSFEEFDSEDSNDFYSKIFGLYSSLLFLAGSFLLLILKPFLHIIISVEFYQSIEIVPILILGVIYQSFSSFLGTNYTAAKRTQGTFYTSVFSGIISIAFSFVLVPKFGLLGASISTLISFVSMFVFRYFDTRKFVKLKIYFKTFYLTNFVYLIQVACLFLIETTSILLVCEFCLFILNIVIHRRTVFNLSMLIINFINRKIKRK